MFVVLKIIGYPDQIFEIKFCDELVKLIRHFIMYLFNI